MIMGRGGEQTKETVGIADVWVREKGLPQPCRGNVVNDLGERILLATDLGPASERVEQRGIELAEGAGASLVITAVLEPDAAADHLDEVARQARERGIDVETRIESGDPVEVILRLAPSVGATGVVVGDDQWRGLLPHPCICAPLIRQASVPVLVLHRSAEHPCDVLS